MSGFKSGSDDMISINSSTNTYDYMNSFFSGLYSTGKSSSSSSSTSTSSLLGDYYSIQNGTYLKLAKKYYASNSNSSSTVDEKQTQLVKSSAETAVSSLSKLMDKNLYSKVSTKDESGNEVMDYDKDKILSNLKTFVEDYNELIENTGDADGNQTLKNGVRLVNQTKVYESALASVGINTKADNTLEIDEDAFKEANMTDVKSLFTGSVSFAKNIQNKVVNIYSSATSTLNSTGGIYSSNGTRSISVGTMFDSLF